MPIVFEKNISTADRCDEKVLMPIVFDVGKGCAHTDPAPQSDTRFIGDVSEFASAEILPEFIASNLIHEINIVKAIAIYVGNCDGAAMVVMPHPHVLGDVIHGMVNERYPARLEFVGKLKIVVHSELPGCSYLGCFARPKRVLSNILFRKTKAGPRFDSRRQKE